MALRLRKMVKVAGFTLIVIGLSFLPSAMVAIYYDEKQCLRTFLMLSLVCIVFGFLMYRSKDPALTRYKSRDGYLAVSITWIICSLIGALPFTLTDSIPSYIDSVFETASGFTTTGCTLIPNVEILPQSILFWRSFTHWIGGMGIIVFAMILFPKMGVGGARLADVETPGPTGGKLTAKFTDTAKKLYGLYFVFTILEIALLMLCDLSFYDAAVQTFGTVGTGGFSNYADSIAHFNSPAVSWIIIIFMYLCGMNFNLFFTIPRQKLKGIFKNSEWKLYTKVLIGASLLIFVDLIFTNPDVSIGKALTDSFFQVTSLMTTTGYMTDDYVLWPTFAQMVLLALFFIGGCTSSTAGGIKAQRVYVVGRYIRRGISMKLHPRRYSSVTVDDVRLPNNVVQGITSFIFCYLFVMALGTLLVSVDGHDLITNLTAVATCIGNVGPGFAEVGPTSNFAFFSPFSKIILSVIMIAGRLELFTLMVVFTRKYWNDNKA